MRRNAEGPELIGKRLFELTEDRFKDSKVDFPASLALQVAGIYYLGLHAKINGSTFCGVDINTSEGRPRVENALRSVLPIIIIKLERILRHPILMIKRVLERCDEQEKMKFRVINDLTFKNRSYGNHKMA